MGELIGIEKAAALHGIAINRAYPQADRLAAAVQALDIYEQEYDALVDRLARPSLYGPVPSVEVPDEVVNELGLDVKPLVQDLAEVLSRMVVGWEFEYGFDLAKHPDVVRVMARYRREHLGQEE